MLPSPTEILGFCEIASTLNITKAASRLGVTQPTLSQSLKKLETTLGEKLLIRSKNGVELTIAGKEFLKHSKQLINYWEKVISETKKSNHEVRGNAKFGCHTSVGLYSIDLFLPKLFQKHPEIEISLTHDLSRKITDKVINYEIDLGLVINPIEHPDLVLNKIFDDEVKVWRASPDSPPILLCHPELLQTQDILKKLKKKKMSYERFITSSSLEILTKLCMKNCGHAILPSRVVGIFDHHKILKPVNDSPIFKDELYLIYRVENKDVQYIKVIRDFVLKNLTP